MPFTDRLPTPAKGDWIIAAPSTLDDHLTSGGPFLVESVECDRLGRRTITLEGTTHRLVEEYGDTWSIIDLDGAAA